MPFFMFVMAFFSGSIPFSVWIGQILLKVDIRKFGDGNPGAANTFRAGSKLAGLLVLLLDISKAAAPVGLAFFTLEIRGVNMFLIAMAPILGHVFSPFLRFRGGKALASSLGVWIGITLWRASLPAVIGAVLGIVLFTPPGWAVICSLLFILLGILVWFPDPLMLAVWLGETIILTWTHRFDLQQGIHLRSWLSKMFTRL